MEGIERLEEAVDVLSAVADDSAALSTGTLKAAMVELHRLEARLTAVVVRLMATIDLRKAWADDGSRSPGAWLARQTNTSPAAARRVVKLAQLRRQMPASQAALGAGEIDGHHAGVLAGSAGSQRKVVAAAFPDAEADLVGLARELPFEDFAKAIRHWENVVDEDGAEDRAAAGREARRLHVSQTFGGNVIVDGQLDAIEGTEFLTALRRIDRELFVKEWATVVEEHGDHAAEAHLKKTPAQRRADALVEVARRAMAAPQGARLPEPLVTAVVGLETLSGRVCELFNRTPITPGQVARVLERADVERVVFRGKSRVIDLGRRERFFTGGLRRVIEIRDRYCQHPGCRTPADECQMDHIHPHGLGGVTTQENGEAKCGPHNRHRNKDMPGLRGKKRKRRQPAKSPTAT
jgi:hypothetical protein